MSNATIGALKVWLGLDNAEFIDGLNKSQAHLKKVGAQMEAIGSSLTGIGGALSLALTAPVLAFGAASIQAARESREAFGQVESALKSMGAASGKTADQLSEAAAELQKMSTFDDDDILRNVTANLLTFGKISGDVFDAAQEAVVNLSARLGQDLQSSAIQVGKALNDPIKGVTALARVGVSFTEQQKDQIKAMVEAGNVAGAQRRILAELERQYGGAALALREATPNAAMVDQWREFQETIGAFAEKVLPPLISAATSVLRAFNEWSPGLQSTAIVVAGVAAAIGPLTIGIGSLITAVGAASAALGGASVAVAALAGPLGLLALAIAAVTAALLANSIEAAKLREANRQLIATQGGAKEVLDRYEEAARAAAASTGKAREAALRHAEALRREAAEAVKAARAIREKALAAAEAAERAAAATRANSDPRTLAGFAGAWAAAEGGMVGAVSPATEMVAKTSSEATQARDRLKAATEAAAAAEARYAKILKGDTIPTVQEVAVVTEMALGRTGNALKAAKTEADEFDKKLKDVLDRLMTDSERATRQAAEDIGVLREAFEKGKISAAEFHEQLLRMRTETASTAPLAGAGEKLTKPWEEASEALDRSIEENEAAWQQSLDRMGYSFRGFFQGWIANGKADWKRLLLDLISDWESTMSVLKGIGSIFSGGKGGGGLSGIFGKIGEAANNPLGGVFDIVKTVGGGLGKALGGVTKIFTGAGSALSGALGSVGSALGSIGGTITGALGGVASTIGAALGPLLGVLGPAGIIAGVAGMLLKSKPSNEAALATFDGSGGYAISGNKRTKETEGAAGAAADAILQGTQALAAFGISLGTTVRQIDIGTRDLTHIFLSNGQELRSAVGDPAAAAETALKAVLQGATFASEAQQTLVESMLAAGKGFDEITASLAAFGEAQNLPQTIADAIKQLSDPQGFDQEQLKREQVARRKSVQAQVDAGYLTAEQFASISAQLNILEGLEVDKAFGRLVGTLDAIASDRDLVRSAYERESSEIDALISRLKSLGASLRTFGQSLSTGPLAMLSPKARYDATRAEFESVREAALRGDEAALSRLPDVAQAFLEASQEFNAATPAYFADLSAVKAAVSATASLTDGLVSGAEAQLEALNKQVAGQIELNKNVVSVKDAINQLGQTLSAYASVKGQNLGANPSANAALIAATGYSGDFGSGGWQAWIVEQSEQVKAAARQVLEAFGQTERIVGFANGGSFRVGGSGGIDSQLVKFRASPDETVTISKPGQLNDGAAEVAVLRQIDQRLATVEGLLGAQINQAAAISNRAHQQSEKQINQLAASTRAQRRGAAA